MFYANEGFQHAYDRKIMIENKHKENIDDKDPHAGDVTESQSGRNRSKIYFFIIAISALLATNIYFYVKFKSSGEKLYTITIQKQDLQIEIDRIEAELDKLTELRSEDSAGVAFVHSENEVREMITGLRVKLENQTLSEDDLLVAKKEVARLKEDVSGFRVTLSDLRTKNELLRRENVDLTKEVSATDQKASELSQENKELRQKVSVASALKVSNVQVNGVSLSKKGKIEIETRARRVDQLQILFSLVDNSLAKVGKEEVFVRVVDPAGNLFGDASNIFYVHGEKLQYTFKDQVMFTNKGEEYQFLWAADKFKKGAYTILLYNQNAIMGRTSVVLK